MTLHNSSSRFVRFQILLLTVLCFSRASRSDDKPAAPVIHAPAIAETETDELRSLQAQKQRKYDEIRERIKELQTEWEPRRQTSVIPVVQPETPATAPSPTERLPVGPSENSSNDSQPAIEPDPPVPNVPEEDTPPQSPLLNPLQPIDGPIDRLALASSLFANGDYELCLQTLRELGSVPDGSAHWVTFLEAGCLRQLDETEEAQRRYRRIVAASDSDWLGELSAWWLDELHEKQELQRRLTQFKSSLDQWEEVVNELTQSTK